MFHFIDKFFIGAMMACCITSCSFINIFDRDLVATMAPDGRRVAKDTDNEWHMFKTVVDADVRSETLGEKASGGRTWNQRWVYSVKAIRRGTVENYQKYADYIIEQRKLHGLPALRGL